MMLGLVMAALSVFMMGLAIGEQSLVFAVASILVGMGAARIIMRGY